MERTVRVFVRGRVQKVGYRAWVGEQAAALRLRGFVRNRRDGSVEAVFSGDAASIARIVESLRRGPRQASVTGVEINEETETALAETFGAHFVVLPTR